VSTGLVLMHEEVISREVTRALDAVAEQRRTAIGAQVPQGFRGVMRDFSGVPGSVLYNLLRNGRLQYIHYLMQKPPVAGS